ncbi:MAG: lipid II flippase MurJ [Actinomycetes bacterium]
MGRSFGSLLPLTIVAQAAGLIASIVLARQLGATRDTDAFFLALLVPSITSAVIAAGLRQGGVPGLTEELNAGGNAQFERSTSALLTAVVIVSLILGAITAAIAIGVMNVSLTDWPTIYSQRACWYTAILSPYTAGAAAIGTLCAALAVKGSFRAAVAVLSIEPIVRTIFMLAAPSWGGYGLVGGNLAGQVISILFLWIVLARMGVRLRPASPRDHRFVRNVAIVSAPLMISQSVLQVNPFVDRGIAASLGSGSVTAFELAAKLSVAPWGLVGGALVSPAIATWAARKAKGGWQPVKESYLQTMQALIVIMFGLVALMAPLSGPIVDLLYGHGAFSGEARSSTITVLSVLLFSIPTLAMISVSAAFFVVSKKTVFPMLIGIGNVIVNTSLTILFAHLIGIGGIALGTVVTYLLDLGVYTFAISRIWRPMNLRSIWPTLLMATLSGLAAASLSLLLQASILSDSSPLLTLAVAGCGASLAYGSIILTTGDRMNILKSALRRA